MRSEPSQTAVLVAVVPLAVAAGLITALLIEDWLVALLVGGAVGALVGFSVNALVKYWLLRD